MRICLLLSVLLLAGCSTISSRIKENPAVFHAMAPGDQALVQTGRIREGFTQNEVYIAWGRPDAIRRTHRANRKIESWIYTGTYHEEIPYWEMHPFGFHCGVFYEPVYRPIIRSIPYFIKAATFEEGIVTSWEENR